MNDRTVIWANWENDCVTIGNTELTSLVNVANNTSIRRARICAHPTVDSIVQEMVIAFARDSYIRPHLHIDKSESFHVIKGEVDVVFFDDSGQEETRIELGEFGSGKSFYFRAEKSRWHSVLVRTELAIIHETTVGPFSEEGSVKATWAPDPSDDEAVACFLNSLRT